TRTMMRKRVEQTLRDAATKGVHRGYLTRKQRAVMLDRQLRQVPRWLGQRRYNGPSGGRNRLKLPPGDTAKHATVSADGERVVWDAYRSVISEAERKGEIHVRGADLGRARDFAVSPAVRPGSRRPHSAYNSELSADGRFVAFETAASTYPLGKRVGQMSILVRDLQDGSVEKISQAARPKGAPTRTAFNPSISDDGRLIAYEATDSGVNGGPSRNGLWVYDREARVQRLVDAQGELGAAYLPRLAGSGTAVAYTSAAEQYGGRTLVYVRSLSDGTTSLVSRADGAAGAAAGSDAYEPSISRDGTVVAFTSRAGNLGGSSKHSTVYVRDLGANTTRRVSTGVGGDAVEPAISADGRFVAFVSRAKFRGGTITALRSKVWLHDRVTGATTLVSRASGSNGAAGNGFGSEPDVSADGSRVVFASTSGNLTPGKPRGLTGVFVRDVDAQTTKLLSDHSAPRGAVVRTASTQWNLCPLGPLTHGAAGAEH
ncbi:MAG: PD40 domain-containing protein, partial [Solirubrobacteraceae bacterium]|nr:PD40 domain-containing protein [Solirubrobacteraceae bacterium]